MAGALRRAEGAARRACSRGAPAVRRSAAASTRTAARGVASAARSLDRATTGNQAWILGAYGRFLAGQSQMVEAKRQKLMERRRRSTGPYEAPRS